MAQIHQSSGSWDFVIHSQLYYAMPRLGFVVYICGVHVLAFPTHFDVDIFSVA